MSDLNSSYIHSFYYYKLDIIDELSCKYIKPSLKDIDNPAVIKKWKNLDVAAYEKDEEVNI